MKKILSMILVLSMLLIASVALAEGMGVQIIGGPETETEPVSLDDIKLKVPFVIDGYGELEFTAYKTIDYLASYDEGKSSYATTVYKSGSEAQYILINADILNTMVTSHDYLAQVEIIVTFDELYEYKGWCYQYNYNNGSSYSMSVGNPDPKEVVINPKDNFAIEPMYEGHYCFGCTLPNAILESDAPLKMVITIDGNELTYNIRK